MSTQQLRLTDPVHVTLTTENRPRGECFHRDHAGQPMCPSLVQRLSRSQFEETTVREALDDGKEPCSQCLGGVEVSR